MYKKFGKKQVVIISAIVAIVVVAALISVFALVKISGGSSNKKGIVLTEAQIRSELSDSDRTLTFEGDAGDLSAFTLVVREVSASNLTSRSYVSNAIYVFMNNFMDATGHQHNVIKAYLAMLDVLDIFEEEGASASEINDLALSIICYGESKTYENWTVSAKINVGDDSLTISVKSN